MARYLVVYYSRSGHTARLAEKIAGLLHADIEKIADLERRGGLIGYLRSGMQGERERPAAIGPAIHDPAGYDMVVLGTPVWAQNMSSPVRAYVQRERAKFRRLALFCTLGGAGGAAALRRIAALCGRAPAAELAVTEAQLKSGAGDAMAGAFASRLQADADAAAA